MNNLPNFSLAKTKFIFNIFYLVITLFIFYNYYQLFLLLRDFIKNNNGLIYFIDLILNFSSNFKLLKSIFGNFFNANFDFFVFMFLLIFIRSFVSQLPIAKELLSQWLSQGEISPIMGRKLASHFRGNYRIITSDFFRMHRESVSEYFLIKYHSHHEESNTILKNHDIYFEKDLALLIETETKQLEQAPKSLFIANFSSKIKNIFKEIKYILGMKN
jgi:hypothetical protein